MKAVVFDKTGSPLDVLRLEEVPAPSFGDDDVLIQMLSASVSPGDFLFIQGLYPDPKKPRFPRQIAGTHGAGIVVQRGKNAKIDIGTLVAFGYYNSWSEYATVPAEWVIPLPRRYPLEKASQLFNLITAWDLLNNANLRPGDWLALTAGNSTISTMVAQFARVRGIKLLSVVRTEATALAEASSDAIVRLASLSGSIANAVTEITNGAGLSAVIDNVGGPISGDLIRSLAFGGRMIVNGGMSEERFELHNFDILLNNTRIEPHVYRFLLRPPTAAERLGLDVVIAQTVEASFKVDVGGTRTLDDFKAAVVETLERPGQGKQFFSMASD